jgi:hypothetical protein
LHKLRTFFFGTYDKNLIMSLAGIHATVISILIGLSIAYVLHINTQISEVETDALKIAEGVNEIRFSPIWFKLVSPSSKFLENWSSKDDQIQQWLSSYWLDPTGNHTIDDSIDGPPFKVYFYDLGLNHTEFKLCLMGALALRYPFPERMVVKNGKRVGLQPSPVLAFSDMKAIEDWSLLVEKKFRVIVDNINWFGSEAFTQRFDWNKEINLHHKFWKTDPEGYSPETLRAFQEIPKQFCSNVENIHGISRTLGYKLKRFSYLMRLNPSKPVVIFTLIASILTFFSGIIIPVVYPTVSKFLIIWIPTMFYSYFLVYLAIKVSSIIGY